MTRSQLTTRNLAVLLGAAVLLYGADYLVLRIRMLHPTPSWPVESVTRTRVLAIPQKSGKTDYQIDQVQPDETLTCVHALFPHLGAQPCWYLKPSANQPIPSG